MVMHGKGKWRGNWRMERVASTLHTTSELGVSNITTADAHTSAASSRLNWRPCRFKWTRPFRRKTKSGFCACAITFQTQSTSRSILRCISETGLVTLKITFDCMNSFCVYAKRKVWGELLEWKEQTLWMALFFTFTWPCVVTNFSIIKPTMRVGTLIVATIYLQLIQNRYMFRSFTLLHCSHQHCVQPVASDAEVVGYL